MADVTFSPDEIKQLMDQGVLNDQTVGRLPQQAQAIYKQMAGKEPASAGGMMSNLRDLVNSILGPAASFGNDFTVGAIKGAGDTVNSIPVLGDVTNDVGNKIADIISLVSPSTIDPNVSDQGYGKPGGVSRRTEDKALDPTNGAQNFGKHAEQVGEFMLGGEGLAKAGAGTLAKMLPASKFLSGATGSRALGMTERALSDLLSGTTVAAAHGDESPATAGLIQAASGPVGAAIAPAARGLVHMTPYGVAAGLAHGFGQDALGLSGNLALMSMLRHTIKNFLDPYASAAGEVVRRGARPAGQALAGWESEANK